MSMLPSKPLEILHISDLHLVIGDLTEERGLRRLWKSSFSTPPAEESGWERLWKSLSGTPATEEESGSERLCQPSSAGVKLKDIDLCVISGDLPLRSPDKDLYPVLRERFDALFPPRNGRRRWIVAPGNHDRRLWGNFFRNRTTFEQGLGKDWKKTWWDPACPCIVVPLDSNLSTTNRLRAAISLARGELGKKQLEHLSEEFRRVRESVKDYFSGVLSGVKTPQEAARCAMWLCAAFDPAAIRQLRAVAYPKPGEPMAQSVPPELIGRTAEILSHLYMARAVRCVVFHHHPVGVPDTDNPSLIRQDEYLLLADAGAFLQSARDSQVSLVLHGHKHVPHRIAVGLPGQDVEMIGIVGAGSSTYRSRNGSTTANLIKINEAGEVNVQLYDPWAPKGSPAAPTLQLRKWSQIREHLRKEASERALMSSEYANVDVTVLPCGDAIVTTQVRRLTIKDQGQHPRGTIAIPIRYTCPTQLGPMQVTCQMERQEYQWQQVAFEPDREPGYGPGDWHGFIRVTLPDSGEIPLTLTTRLLAFTTFAMNPWQASFMYRDAKSPFREYYRWRCEIPVHKQFFVALETTGDKAAAATFDEPSRLYARIDGTLDDLNDQPEREGIVIDRAASGRRIAFTAPMPLWGSQYGIDWDWGRRPHAQHEDVPDSSPLRNCVEEEARLVRANGRSPLGSRITALLQNECPESEATLFALVRPADNDSGKLVPLAWNRVAGRSWGPRLEMNFGAGVAGRAASLQKTIGWVRPSPSAVLEDRLVDFYLPLAESSGHTGILAVPIPRCQPLAILSLASRQADDRFCRTLHDILEQEAGERVGRYDGFAWIRQLAREIEKLLQEAQRDIAREESPTSEAKRAAEHFGSDDTNRPNTPAPPVGPAEKGRWDDAIHPVDPDQVRRRLERFEIDLYGDDVAQARGQAADRDE